MKEDVVRVAANAEAWRPDCIFEVKDGNFENCPISGDDIFIVEAVKMLFSQSTIVQFIRATGFGFTSSTNPNDNPNNSVLGLVYSGAADISQPLGTVDKRVEVFNPVGLLFPSKMMLIFDGSDERKTIIGLQMITFPLLLFVLTNIFLMASIKFGRSFFGNFVSVRHWASIQEVSSWICATIFLGYIASEFTLLINIPPKIALPFEERENLPTLVAQQEYRIIYTTNNILESFVYPIQYAGASSFIDKMIEAGNLNPPIFESNLQRAAKMVQDGYGGQKMILVTFLDHVPLLKNIPEGCNLHYINAPYRELWATMYTRKERNLSLDFGQTTLLTDIRRRSLQKTYPHLHCSADDRRTEGKSYRYIPQPLTMWEVQIAAWVYLFITISGIICLALELALNVRQRTSKQKRVCSVIFNQRKKVVTILQVLERQSNTSNEEVK